MSILRGRAWQGLQNLGLLFLICGLILALATAGFAEVPKNKKNAKGASKTATIDQITPFDGNRIYNYIVNNGDIVTDNVGGHSGFAWPSVPRTNRSQTEADLIGPNTADYSSGLWICGTVNGQGRTAIVEYVSEYIAGKILPDGTRDNATLEKYRVYKIIKGDGPGVKDYDEWPVADGAPTNPDGTPQLIGDQTLWFVMNDLEASRHQGAISGSPPIGLEVQTTVFGFNRADALGDVMFVRWVIINKGTAALDSAFIGVWDDPDLGDASDDLVGCDTTLGLGFCYNGDPNDGSYGTRTPALGFDFFQGPEAPSGSGNRLKMTSFAKYTNGAPAGRGDPVNVEEVYNYMTGRWANGDNIVDPTTGQVTKFIHAGDPVTRRGDLDFSPSDRRFLMSSGPFTLGVGETQVVVGAKIAAPGANPSSSISALRFYDLFAQSAFDNDFQVITPVAPTVAVTRLDQEIVLDWSQGYQPVENFEDQGYKFQGYRVFQSSALSGGTNFPIAVYDLPDGIQNVYDLGLDAETGLIVEKPVIVASDAGIKRYISIKTDAVFNVNQRLSNYRDYYFAVTAYSVNLTATPRVIETPVATFRVAPSRPDYGTSVNAKTGTTVDLTRAGTGDGNFYYQVVDPTKLVTANYSVTWNDDSTPEEGNYTYNVLKNNTPLLTNLPQLGFDSEGNPRNDAPIFDGLQLQVLPATFSSPTTIFADGPVTDANGSLSLWGDYTVFGGATGFYSDAGNGLPYPPVSVAQGNLEFRFTGKTAAGDDNNDAPITEGGQWSTQWPRASFGAADLSGTANVQVRAPFELWDVEKNQQLNFAVINRNADGTSPYANNIGDPNTAGMEPRYRMTGRDYIVVIASPYDPATAATTVHSHTDPNISWLLFFDQTGGSVWNTGDVYEVQFANPTIPGTDAYGFATQRAVVTNQAATAQQQLNTINVVPNPYWAFNAMETDPINRFVRLTNLPGQGATIRIFTLAGELVRVIDDADRAADNTLGLQYAGWDLRNDAGVPVASGVYILHFEIANVGTAVRKAVVVMPEERLDVF